MRGGIVLDMLMLIYIEEEKQGTRYENTKIAWNKYICVQSIIVKYSFYPINSIKVIMLRPPSILERGPGWCSKYIVIPEISRDVMNNGTLSWFVMDKIFEVKLDYFYISQLDIGGFL